MDLPTMLREELSSVGVGVEWEKKQDADGWQMLAITLRPMLSKPFVYNVPIPRRCPGFDGRRYRHPVPRAIKTETGTIRLIHDELCEDGTMITYEMSVHGVFAKHVRAIKHSAKRLNRDTWVGAHQAALELKEMLNRMPVRTKGCIGRDYTIGNRVYVIIPELGALPPDDREAKLNDIVDEYFGGLFPTSVSDNMRVDACASRVDLRNYAPFTKFNHHPKRPLVQILQGLETIDPRKRPEVSYPWVVTQHDYDEFDGKFCGTGLNLLTAYVTSPLTYEDQIIMNAKWRDIVTVREHRYTVNGDVLVEVGANVQRGHRVGRNKDYSYLHYEHEYKDAVVTSIDESTAIFDGRQTDVKIVTITSYTYGANGRKVTNRHGGKGVVRFKEEMPKVLMPDGTQVEVDVIVDADSPLRRKNTGQIIECLYTLANAPFGTESQIVVPYDHWDRDRLSAMLVQHGLPSNGQFPLIYPGGETIETVCGRMFWMIIEDPHSIGTPEESICEED